MNDFYFPFEEKDKIFTDTAIERRMSGESFPKPANASEEFGCIILKACEFDTSKRYPTINDMLYDLENIGFSRPAPAYSPVESADFYSDNATQYAGECYPEEDVTPVAEETDTYEYDENLYETNESDFEIKDGVLIKYNGTDEYVKIPYGVTEIGWCAFYSCENLTSVIIPNSVIEIGTKAFHECRNLTSVTIPYRFKSRRKNIFPDCLKFSVSYINKPETLKDKLRNFMKNL